MIGLNGDRVIEKANELLKVEKDILLSGDLRRLTGLAEKKAEIAESLGRISLSRRLEPSISELKIRARANSELYEAVQAGLNAVRQRIDLVRRASEGFQVYDADRQVCILRNSKSGQTI